MKLRHVLPTIGFGFLTLGLMCGGLVFWESETGTLERHFEAREKRLTEAFHPVLAAALENPKVTDVTGPVQQCVRTGWARTSSPFGDNSAYTLAVRGPKGDAVVQFEAEFEDPRWNVTKFEVGPPSPPFSEKTFTEFPPWDASLDWEDEQLEAELEVLDEAIETSVTLAQEEGGLRPPDPPRPSSRRSRE